MFFALLAWLTTAAAVTPDELEARLAEIESMRSMRLAKGAPTVSTAQVRRAAEGGVVADVLKSDGSPMGKGYASVVLDVSIGTLWSAINDETRHPGYTAVSYAEVIEGRPCESGRRVLQSVSVPVIGDKWWIGVPVANRELSRYSGGAVRELKFQSSTNSAEVTSASGMKILAAAEPIGSSYGGWFMVALDSRHTYLEYFVQTDPGGRIPGWMVTSAATKGVRDTIGAIRRFAKEGNPACPIE